MKPVEKTLRLAEGPPVPIRDEEAAGPAGGGDGGAAAQSGYGPTEPSVIISLMKILRCKAYVEDFLDGKLYCNTVRHFRETCDEFEGAAFLHPTTLRIGSHRIPEEDLVGPVVLTPNLVSDLNLFCMFSWRAPNVGDDEILIDLESQLGSLKDCIRDFGPYAVIVKNATEFLRRVERSAVREKLLFHARGPVRYINPDTFRTNPAELSRIPFFKDEQFVHQKEYRFVFRTGLEPAVRLDLPIGDIRDIAFCMKTEDIYNSVTVEDVRSSSASVR